MAENQENFYWEDEDGNKTPLSRMTREQCNTVIRAMAEEIAYWRSLDAMVKGIMAAEDGAEATLQ